MFGDLRGGGLRALRVEVGAHDGSAFGSHADGAFAPDPRTRAGDEATRPSSLSIAMEHPVPRQDGAGAI